MPESIVAWGVKDIHTSAQLVLAKRLGFFQRYGLQVECKLFPSEESCLHAFEHSSAPPFIWTQTLPHFLALRANGLPIRIISPLADISASYQFVIRTESGIVLPADLQGRRIGLVQGSFVEILFHNMAKDFQLDLSKIIVVNASPIEQLELFANREIDVVACWEPWTSQACYIGGTRYFSGLYSFIPGHEGRVNWLTGQSLLVTFEEHIRHESDALLACLRGIEHATTYLNSTLQKAASVFSDLLDTDKEELVTLLQKNIYAMQMNELFYIGLVSGLELFSQSRPSAIFAAAELYDTRLLAQIQPGFVRQDWQTHADIETEIVADHQIYYPTNVRFHLPQGRTPRYIVVDDTQIVVEMFCEMIEMIGGKVVGTASTGAQAMILYADQLPDIVAIDISMPDMNGIEAIKNILRMNPLANIIVVSGNSYEHVRQEVFRLGVKLFIAKPFHVPDILRLLQQFTQEQGKEEVERLAAIPAGEV